MSVSSVCAASLVCFYLLAFRDGVFLRSLGSTLAFVVVGSAYPLIAAVPLSTLLPTTRRLRFLFVFSISFLVAIALMVTTLALFPGMAGGFAAGMLATSLFGFAIAYGIGQRRRCLVIGPSLACWTFIGDYLGYNARNMVGGMAGMMTYAGIYSLFLGSGLGVLLWHIQKNQAAGAGRLLRHIPAP